jgi:HD-like signal output (HDOD) protein
MITTQDIETYISRIPPTPAILKKTLAYVKAGDLHKAAACAEEDAALSSYLKAFVNRPIFGFRSEVTKLSQIFGILGTAAAQQMLYSYMLSLLSPKEWKLFQLKKNSFADLQAHLSKSWKDILKHLAIDDKEIISAISLLPATIIVCEALFSNRLEEVTLLRSVKDLDYNTILKRLTEKDLFDISEMIATKWEFSDNIITIIHASNGNYKPQDSENPEGITQNALLGKWMHLLLFYTFSKPEFITAGLNDFIDFNVEYVGDIYEDFMTIMNITEES